MAGIQIAFKDFKPLKGIWGSPWATSKGSLDLLKHFERFLGSKYSLQIITNTVLVSLYALLANFPCCILLALMMNEIRSRAFKKYVQFVTYAPHFISTIVLVAMMQQMFASPSALMKTGGIVNTVLLALGFDSVDFMTSSATFRSMYAWNQGVWSGVGGSDSGSMAYTFGH